MPFPSTYDTGPFAPLYLGNDAIITGGSSGSINPLAANAVLVQKYVLTAHVTVPSMRWKSTATAAGYVDLGIYTSDGNTLLGHTTAIHNNVTATNNTANINGGSITLAPGVYLLAMTMDNNTDTFTRVNNLGSAGVAMTACYTAANASTGSTTTLSLPTTLGALTFANIMVAFIADVSI